MRDEVEKYREGGHVIKEREESWLGELTQTTCELHICQDRVRVLEEELAKCREELDSVKGELSGTQRILQMANSEVYIYIVLYISRTPWCTLVHLVCCQALPFGVGL